MYLCTHRMALLVQLTVRHQLRAVDLGSLMWSFIQLLRTGARQHHSNVRRHRPYLPCACDGRYFTSVDNGCVCLHTHTQMDTHILGCNLSQTATKGEGTACFMSRRNPARMCSSQTITKRDGSHEAGSSKAVGTTCSVRLEKSAQMSTSENKPIDEMVQCWHSTVLAHSTYNGINHRGCF